MLEKFRQKISGINFPVIQYLFLITIFLSIPVTVFLAQNRQDIRQKAQTSDYLLYSNEPDYSYTRPLNINGPVYHFFISGKIELKRSNSFIRIILVDKNNYEYLVYESYPLITQDSIFDITKECEETCILKGITADHLRIEGNTSSLKIDEALVSDNYEGKKLTEKNVDEEIKKVKEEKDNIKLQKINRRIIEKGAQWIAGKNEFSEKTYAEKKKIFSNPDGTYLNHIPNLQGFDYYIGGIFELPDRREINQNFTEKIATPSAIPTIESNSISSLSPTLTVKTPGSTPFPKRWDYRNWHGENWMTPVRNQGSCGSSWAFTTTGATETVASLYFNRHLDLDLSEQDALSCSNAGSCSGGWPSTTLDYYTNTGAISETCFPYQAANLVCQKCTTWQNKTVKIGGRENYDYTESWLKEKLIGRGVISAGIYSWRQAMLLLGWETDPADNSTVWIFKNSWGTSWGESGYARIKTHPSNIEWTNALLTPVILANNASLQIACVDKDNDSYCNWGISETKPSTCPARCKALKDCDDSDPSVMIYDADYNCIRAKGIKPLPPSKLSPTPTSL